MVEWVPRKRTRKREYRVYHIVFPDGSSYVGYTSKPFLKRWSTHAGRTTKSLVNDKLYEFGIEQTKVRIMAKFDDMQDALDEEKRLIKELKPTLNKTKGGEKGPIGVKRRRSR